MLMTCTVLLVLSGGHRLVESIPRSKDVLLTNPYTGTVYGGRLTVMTLEDSHSSINREGFDHSPTCGKVGDMLSTAGTTCLVHMQNLQIILIKQPSQP